MQTTDRGRWNWVDWLTVGLGTGLYLGLIPLRSATFASLLGVGLAIVLSWTGDWPTQAIILLGLWALGGPICGRSARLLGQKDPRSVVYDEITTIPLVSLGQPSTTAVLAAAFVLHRLFDITKPGPVRWAERLPGGWGIMADDVVAAGLGWVVLALLRTTHWLPFLD